MLSWLSCFLCPLPAFRAGLTSALHGGTSSHGTCCTRCRLLRLFPAAPTVPRGTRTHDLWFSVTVFLSYSRWNSDHYYIGSWSNSYAGTVMPIPSSIRIPSLMRFLVALASRSCCVPHTGQHHSRMVGSFTAGFW